MMIEYANNADVIGSRALMPALHGVADQVTGGLPWSRLRRVVEYVQTNLTGELSLAELSALVHMSPYHFARLFKKSIGVSPRQFVIRRRIAAAKLLLAERSRPMGEVALAVGFSSKSHFTTIFLRITGVTPGHYRAAVHVGDAFGTSGDGPELLLSPGDGPELGRGPAGDGRVPLPPGHRCDSGHGRGCRRANVRFGVSGSCRQEVPECTRVAGHGIRSAKSGLK
jgi:AraC-like DNA-binding protein